MILSKNVSQKSSLGQRKANIKGSFRDTVSAMIEPEKETKGAHKMKGYYTGNGYYGYVDGRYVLFSSESDYYESVEADAA